MAANLLKSVAERMMRQHASDPQSSQLCYLDAAKVETPAGVLSELGLRAASGEPLGRIVGVVIEATERRARYFVVEPSSWIHRRRYLLEIDQTAQVEPDKKFIRLRANCDVQKVRDLDAATLRRFSDDDLVAAMFHRAA